MIINNSCSEPRTLKRSNSSDPSGHLEGQQPNKKTTIESDADLLLLPHEMFVAIIEQMDFPTFLNFRASFKDAYDCSQFRWKYFRKEHRYHYPFAMTKSHSQREKYIVAHIVRKFIDSKYGYITSKNHEYWSAAIVSLAKNEPFHDLTILLPKKRSRKKVDEFAQACAGEAILKAENSRISKIECKDLFQLYAIAVSQGMRHASYYAVKRYDQLPNRLNTLLEVRDTVVNMTLEAAQNGEYDGLEQAVRKTTLRSCFQMPFTAHNYPPLVGMMGDNAMHSKSFQEAIPCYEEVLKSYEGTQIDTSYYFHRLTQAYSRLGHYVKAIECFERVLGNSHSSAKKRPRLYYHAANDLFKEQKFEQALVHYQKINLSTAPNLTDEVLARSAYAEYKLGRIQVAMRLCNQLIAKPLS